MTLSIDRGRSKVLPLDSAEQRVLEHLAQLLKLLAHPQRLRIVLELGRQECNVGALQSRLGIAPSGVSQHLGLLRAYGLVVDRRVGRLVYYRLVPEGLAPWLTRALDLLQGDPTALRLGLIQEKAPAVLCPRPTNS